MFSSERNTNFIHLSIKGNGVGRLYISFAFPPKQSNDIKKKQKTTNQQIKNHIRARLSSTLNSYKQYIFFSKQIVLFEIASSTLDMFQFF